MWQNLTNMRQKMERASRFLTLPSFLWLTIPQHNSASILLVDASRGQAKGHSFFRGVATWPCTTLYLFSLFFFPSHSWFPGCATYLDKVLACQFHHWFSVPVTTIGTGSGSGNQMLNMQFWPRFSHLEEVWWSNLCGMWNITNANYFTCP